MNEHSLPRSVLSAGMALVWALITAGANAEWILDGTTGVEFDDNLPRAQLDSDIESDVALDAALSAGQFVQLTDRIGFTLVADLRGAHYAEFDGLDYASAGLTTSLRGKLGLGADAPWVQATAGFAAYDHRFEPRDGLRYRAGLAAGRSIGTRLNLTARYAFERRRSDEVTDIPFLVNFFGIHGDAFDGDNHSLSISGTYTVTQRLALVVGYTRRMGDVTATTRINEEIFEYSDAIAPDPVFGQDKFAYRIDADTDIFNVDLSFALGDHTALNFGYEYRDSNAGEDLTYTNNIARIGLRFRY
ncbi:MAG: hypothetical protein ACREXT_09700 [Gammaproteobacteria bacterium]